MNVTIRWSWAITFPAYIAFCQRLSALVGNLKGELQKLLDKATWVPMEGPPDEYRQLARLYADRLLRLRFAIARLADAIHPHVTQPGDWVELQPDVAGLLNGLKRIGGARDVVCRDADAALTEAMEWAKKLPENERYARASEALTEAMERAEKLPEDMRCDVIAKLRSALTEAMERAEKLPENERYEAIPELWWAFSMAASEDVLPYDNFAAECDELARQLMTSYDDASRRPRPAELSAGDPAPTPTQPRATDATSADLVRQMMLIYGGSRHGEIGPLATVLKSEVTLNDKLTQLDDIHQIPATTSAAKLAEALGVSKQAICKTSWWQNKRCDSQRARVAERQNALKQRGRRYEQQDHAD